MNTRTASVTITALAMVLVAGAAEAQTTRHRAVAHARPAQAYTIAEISSAPPLTIRRRSFLDPGNVVPVGSETPEYIRATTTDVRPITAYYAPAFFGESALPGRFDLPPTNPRFNPSSEPRIPLPFDE